MIDVTVLLRPGTPEWPGDTPYSCGWTWRMADGASVNLSAMTLSPHVGTHADAPLHVHDGWPASDALPLTAFRGAAVVVDVSTLRGEISVSHLGPLPNVVERLLLKTDCSIASGSFPDEWPTLSEHAVAELLRRGLRLLGVDAPSVDARESKSLENHHRLFGAGAYIIENLDLREAEPGLYHLTALPLRVEGLDAAPLRAVLDPIG